MQTMAAKNAVTTSLDRRYAKEFLAGWGTMDFNGHMGNTAYLNLAADVRMAFLADHNFPPSELRRLAIGPVVKKEEIEYFKELFAAFAQVPKAPSFVELPARTKRAD